MNLPSLLSITPEHPLRQEASVEEEGLSSEAEEEVVVTNVVDVGTSRTHEWVAGVDSRHIYTISEEGHEEDEEIVVLVVGRITTSLSATETPR